VELVFLKLGGSVITDKGRPETAREDVIRRAAREIKGALQGRKLRLLLGHGSGSYGHYPAKKYGVQEGLRGDFWGLAETGAVAARLNRLVTDTFLEEGVAVLSLQPSASALASKGRLICLERGPIENALAKGLVPLVYGDVAFDEVKGSCIISTEEIFAYLAWYLRPSRIILACDVDGIYDGDPRRDPKARLKARISPQDLAPLEKDLGGSCEVDVTGGMLAKVRIMAELVNEVPGLKVHFISGEREGLIEGALVNPDSDFGTILTA
jgi:isopentenyl phosphate kinase